MLARLSTSLLTNAELPDIAQRIVAEVASSLPEHDFIQKLVTLIQEDVDELESTIGRSRGSEFTQRLTKLDDERGDAFVALRDFAKATMFRKQPDVAAAGRFVYATIRERGLQLHRLSYAEQSTQFNLLIEDLAEPEAQQALSTMNAIAWLEDLKVSQDAFRATVKQRDVAESQMERPQISSVRSRLHRHLTTLLWSVEAIHEFTNEKGAHESTATLNTLGSVLNEMISGVMSIARARRSRGEAREMTAPDRADRIEERLNEAEAVLELAE